MLVLGQLTSISGGLATASVRGQVRPVFLNPSRAAAPWPVPAIGDWVALGPGARGQWHVLAVLGQGVPTATRP